MELLLSSVLSYFISIAANSTSSRLNKTASKELKDLLDNEVYLREQLRSDLSISEHIENVCKRLSLDLKKRNLNRNEILVWMLLSEKEFKSDFEMWFLAGNIPESDESKSRILNRIKSKLTEAMVDNEDIEIITSKFFDQLEISVFSNQTLLSWRLQKNVEYLRTITDDLKCKIYEAGGIFSAQKKQDALSKYCQLALDTWDIIDLSGLPEDDVYLATQSILLRQLYMPLRIEFEDAQTDDELILALSFLEDERVRRQKIAAGRIQSGSFETDSPNKMELSVGLKLQTDIKLVILGDPGGGKTTMLRWLATAYLLRLTGEDSFLKLPDIDTLPAKSLLPILIRCRDLGEQDLARCFDDFLCQHLKKTELLPEQAEVMKALILERMVDGTALLLIDGLDEISNVRVRTMFCQEIERTAARYPETTIVVTSRIVGYRDMPHRMSSIFKHGQISQLNRADKIEFARNWIEVTEQSKPTQERDTKVKELLEAIEVNDRIDKLTGNPMLLTTLALVKRKVGKLPNKRTKLYSEAVSVLLNWNRSLYETIDEEEAIPQLEFLAFEMCRLGVQSLRNDEVLTILDDFRIEYPNIRAVKKRPPEDFLALLEARSSIIIKSGGFWQNDKTVKDVWEFRHLTFQEYLAARALIDGRYKGRNKKLSLAEQISELAGTVDTSDKETTITESWRETLRLLVSDCKDDDIDEVLSAIMTPLPTEDQNVTKRPRAILAASCLADEPNVGEDLADKILDNFCSEIQIKDGSGNLSTSLDYASDQIAASHWKNKLQEKLLDYFFKTDGELRYRIGGVLACAAYKLNTSTFEDATSIFEDTLERLNSNCVRDRVFACLEIMQKAFSKNLDRKKELSNIIIKLTENGVYETTAATWALVWLAGGWGDKSKDRNNWRPNKGDVEHLCRLYYKLSEEEYFIRSCIIGIVEKHNSKMSIPIVIDSLKSNNKHLYHSAHQSATSYPKEEYIAVLSELLNNENIESEPLIWKSLAAIDTNESISILLKDIKINSISVQEKHQLVLGLSKSKNPLKISLLVSIFKVSEERFILRECIKQLCNFDKSIYLEKLPELLMNADKTRLSKINRIIQEVGSISLQKEFKKHYLDSTAV